MADYYIATTGNDTTGAGTLVSPWLTISKAHTACAASGDTIHVAAGTYTWVTQTFTKNVTLQGASAATTIFDAGADLAAARFVATLSMTVNDIHYRNNGINDHDVGLIGGASSTPIPTLTYNRCIFSDLHINLANGYILQQPSAIFGNQSAGQYHTIDYVFNSCVFYDIDAASNGGIFGFSSSVSTGGVTMNNCTMYLDTSGINHVFRMHNAGTAVTCTNCIFQSVGDSPTYFQGSGTSTATYCDVNGFTSAPTGTGVITADPLLIDPANADFHLRPTSPCIDSGTTV